MKKLFLASACLLSIPYAIADEMDPPVGSLIGASCLVVKEADGFRQPFLVPMRGTDYNLAAQGAAAEGMRQCQQSRFAGLCRLDSCEPLYWEPRE